MCIKIEGVSVLLLTVLTSLSLCSYWTGYVTLCKKLKRYNELFSTIVSLQDDTLLQDIVSEGNI